MTVVDKFVAPASGCVGNVEFLASRDNGGLAGKQPAVALLAVRQIELMQPQLLIAVVSWRSSGLKLL